MVLAHVALVRRLVEVLAVLQGGTHAYGVKMFYRLEEESAVRQKTFSCSVIFIFYG